MPRFSGSVTNCAAQGKGAFLTEPEELIDDATELDHYLMGVRRASEAVLVRG